MKFFETFETYDFLCNTRNGMDCQFKQDLSKCCYSIKQEPRMQRMLFPKSYIGHNFVKKQCTRVTALGQIVALVLLNKCILKVS